MNLQYHQFGDGLTMRGNPRPTIATAGISYNTSSLGVLNDISGPRRSYPYGAAFSPAEITRYQFMMPKDPKHPWIPTTYGLNTQQLAYKNCLKPGGNAGGYNAGMTGTHGSAGFFVGQNGHGIRKTGGIMVGQNGHGIRKLIGGHPGVWDPQAKGMVESGHGVKFPTGGMYKRKGKKKSKKSKGSKKSRKTGGNYLDIRNAINKISSAGFYKKKKRSSKRTTRRKH